jgi:hypothetical protein
MKPYYYVALSTGKRHESLESARAESLRLAALNPGRSFEILMCIGITQVAKPSTFWMDGIEPQITSNNETPTPINEKQHP